MFDPRKGERGRVGETGDEGKQGKTGERGRTGAEGAAGSPPLSRVQTLAMFVFVVAAFVVLAYRTEVNFSRAEVNFDDNLDDTYRACTQTNRTVVAVNEILDQLIVFEGIAPPELSKAEEQKRAREYEALKTVPLECPSPS